MDRYKKTNLRSPYIGPVVAAVLLALVSSSGLYAPSFGVQQNQLQQSATIVVAGSDESMTATPPSAGNDSTASITSITNRTRLTNLPNATLVEFVSNIEQIRGHLDQAVINKESANNTLAEAHIHHPIEEVYSSIEDQLASQDNTLNQTLSGALQNLTSSVINAELEEFESQIDYVEMLLNNSVEAIVPSSELDNNVAFSSSVVARLLHVAGHEYEEAVANGTVMAEVEYQDGQAFINRAESIFNSATGRINQNMTPEVEEVNEFFSILNSAVLNKEDLVDIDGTINDIINELAEITGLSQSQLVGEETSA